MTAHESPGPENQDAQNGGHMGPAAPSPAPAPTPESEEEAEIDLTDSSELKPENLAALLARAKRASAKAVKKTRMAFDTTKALADTGMLKTQRFKSQTRSLCAGIPKQDTKEDGTPEAARKVKKTGTE